VNDLKTLGALFALDSSYGRWHGTVTTSGVAFNLNGNEISYVDSSKGVPNWGEIGVELVVGCSGRVTKREARRLILIRERNMYWSARRASHWRIAMLFS
jgi:glyceraldehyde 3-phosphate dehydrogenase